MTNHPNRSKRYPIGNCAACYFGPCIATPASCETAATTPNEGAIEFAQSIARHMPLYSILKELVTAIREEQGDREYRGRLGKALTASRRALSAKG